MITNFQSQAKIQAKNSGLHADQITFLENITEIKEQMKVCKIEPNQISLWGAAVKDEDAVNIFKEGILDQKSC